MFPENDMLGIDFIIPDWKYLRDKRDQLRGIIITHGHEDHTGGLPYLLKEMPEVPVFATKLTRGLIEVKLRNHKTARSGAAAPRSRPAAGSSSARSGWNSSAWRTPSPMASA